MVKQIEAWSESLENTADPVELRISGFPIVSTMYLDGERIGKFERVVVLRESPGDVDSLHVIARVDDRHLARLKECNFSFDPDALKGAFPTEGWKRVLRCEANVSGLTPFGTVIFEGSGQESPLYVERWSSDCGDVSAAVSGGGVAPNVTVSVDCVRSHREQVRTEVRRLRDQIRRDVRKRGRTIRVRVP